jgi:hypothetical protein
MPQKIIRLTEADLNRIVKKIIKESDFEHENLIRGVQKFLNEKLKTRLKIDGKTLQLNEDYFPLAFSATKSIKGKPAVALNELFGGAPALTGGDALAIPLAQAIQKPENGDAARKIIVDVIETQKQLNKDSKTADFLMTCCSRAHALLLAAVNDGFRAEAKLEGVGAQLDQIQIQADKIRTYLSANVKD